MRSAVERARGLVHKSDHDFAIARLGLQHREALDMVCFHLQQALEKLLKAVLECHEIEYPPTHSLVALLDLAQPVAPSLGVFGGLLPEYMPYAVRARYDEALYPSLQEAEIALEHAEQFRSVVRALLPPEVTAAER
jgi:HEPN domain-containing protein